MAVSIADFRSASDGDSQRSPQSVRRSPTYVVSNGAPLFAWLHEPQDIPAVNHGVMICPPLGFEQLHSHRTLRHLADHLAASGLPTVRFDWHGTGDSAGCDADPARRLTWRNNVRDVLTWMRERIGLQRISVVGLRLGATLAVESLEEYDCENLVLWSPVSSGKAYLRQMQAIEMLAEHRPQAPDAKPGDIEAAGFLIQAETAEQISLMDLMRSPIHCARGLLVGPFDKRLVEHFTQLDLPVDQISPPGFAEMLAEPHFSQVPWTALQQITEWLECRILPTAAPLLKADDTRIGERATLLKERHTIESHQTLLRERILSIGGDPNRFGIITEPLEPSSKLPTILLLNAGAANHVGPGRFNVDLARRFARDGYRCLRIDACGLGDSVSANPADENHPYPTTVFRDIEAACDDLRLNYGVEQVVVMGLCSGAYAAFQSAAQLSHPSIVESILINPLTFHWQDGMPFDASVANRLLKESDYLEKAFDPRKVWRLLSGKTEIGYAGALRLLKRRIAHYWKSSALKSPCAESWPPTATAVHPAEGNLPRDLAHVVASKRRLALFLAENDPGYAVMSFYALRQVKKMRKSQQLYIETVPSGDHTFSRRGPRANLVQALLKYLHDRYC